MVNAAEMRTGGAVGPQHHGVPVAPTVLSMLQSARRGLDEAGDETAPGARYVMAHLAALRAAAAVVAASRLLKVCTISARSRNQLLI